MLLVAGTLLHAYVAWRASGVPAIARRVSGWTYCALSAGLWFAFATATTWGRGASGALAVALEAFGLTWLTTLFLVAVPMVATDLVTGFGLWMPIRAPRLRGLVLLVGLAMAATALVQGHRPPVASDFEVELAELPADADGTVLVGLSDLHVGEQLGADWLRARVDQVLALKPDAIVLLGDLFEGHGRPDEAVLAEFRRLTAPLGVWAVTGNHERFRGGSAAEQPIEQIGATVLHDRWAEIRPGLVVAGVDDLTSRRRRGQEGDAAGRALTGRPLGAVVLLSHTPWSAERAAAAGARLMLSGHTHAGQVWPFAYLVRSVYPLVEGRHDVDGMAVIVSRGAGTWGPRMRLWKRGEILRVTLRSPGTPLPR
jgi:hypothetical protein